MWRSSTHKDTQCTGNGNIMWSDVQFCSTVLYKGRVCSSFKLWAPFADSMYSTWSCSNQYFHGNNENDHVSDERTKPQLLSALLLSGSTTLSSCSFLGAAGSGFQWKASNKAAAPLATCLAANRSHAKAETSHGPQWRNLSARITRQVSQEAAEDKTSRAKGRLNIEPIGYQIELSQIAAHHIRRWL